jgi:hypothetical protein
MCYNYIMKKSREVARYVPLPCVAEATDGAVNLNINGVLPAHVDSERILVNARALNRVVAWGAVNHLRISTFEGKGQEVGFGVSSKFGGVGTATKAKVITKAEANKHSLDMEGHPRKRRGTLSVDLNTELIKERAEKHGRMHNVPDVLAATSIEMKLGLLPALTDRLVLGVWSNQNVVEKLYNSCLTAARTSSATGLALSTMRGSSPSKLDVLNLSFMALIYVNCLKKFGFNSDAGIFSGLVYADRLAFAIGGLATCGPLLAYEK